MLVSYDHISLFHILVCKQNDFNFAKTIKPLVAVLTQIVDITNW